MCVQGSSHSGFTSVAPLQGPNPSAVPIVLVPAVVGKTASLDLLTPKLGSVEEQGPTTAENSRLLQKAFYNLVEEPKSFFKKV